MLPLPKLTSDNERILYYRLADTDPKNVCLISYLVITFINILIILYFQYHFDDIIRAFFIVGDVRLVIPDDPEREDFVCTGEIPIFDMAGFSWRHATKVVISTLRVYMKYTQVN